MEAATLPIAKIPTHLHKPYQALLSAAEKPRSMQTHPSPTHTASKVADTDPGSMLVSSQVSTITSGWLPHKQAHRVPSQREQKSLQARLAGIKLCDESAHDEDTSQRVYDAASAGESAFKRRKLSSSDEDSLELQSQGEQLLHGASFDKRLTAQRRHDLPGGTVYDRLAISGMGAAELKQYLQEEELGVNGGIGGGGNGDALRAVIVGPEAVAAILAEEQLEAASKGTRAVLEAARTKYEQASVRFQVGVLVTFCFIFLVVFWQPAAP